MAREREPQKVKPYTTSVAEARLTGVVKFSLRTRGLFAAAAGAHTARLLEHSQTFTYRGAQLWQLGTAGVVAWIDGIDEGATVFPDVDTAREHYARVCTDLAQRPPRTSTPMETK